MYRGSKPRILPLIIAIVVIALIIAGVVSLARMIFFSSDTTNQNEEQVSMRDEVLDTTTGRSVRYTVRGSIVADENFSSYQITVSPSARTYVAYSGYLETPTQTRSFANSTKAYEEFVHALDKADIAKTRKVENDDIRGVCATNGRLYVFETLNLNTVTSSVWTSTCSGSKGSMGANISQIHALFANQIPDFEPMFDKTQ